MENVNLILLLYHIPVNNVNLFILENEWMWQFLGRLHPMVIHFPLSLLILAAILEMITLRNYHSKWRHSINVLLWTGSFSAVLSAGLGYLLMIFDEYEGAGVDIHQNLGIATAVLSVVCLWLSRKIGDQPVKAWLWSYRTTLSVTSVALILTGHYGASLTHGSDFLTELLPWDRSENINSNQDLDLSLYDRDVAEISDQDMLQLLTGVRAVFAHSCYRCHGSDKIKGELRLDEREFVFQGGENGPIIEVGQPENSELIRRISLPADHEDIMPSKGDFLSEDQIAMISLWVEKGAYWPENADDLKIFRNAPLAPRYPEWPSDTSRFENKIDVWTDQYFADQEMAWQEVVDDRDRKSVV